MKKIVVNLSEGTRVVEDFTDEERTEALEKRAAHDAETAANKHKVNRVYGTEDDTGKRLTEGYASIGDQLDMIYKDQVNGTTTWKDHIAKVKSDHPKG